MEPNDRCAFPNPDAEQTPRRWASVHGGVVAGAWLLCASGLLPLVFGARPWATAGACFAGAMALVMLGAGRLVPGQRLRAGSGMNARTFTVFWNGQTLGCFFCVALIGVAQVTWGSAVSQACLVFVVAATLLAQLTPFCAGRLAYLVLFERPPRR